MDFGIIFKVLGLLLLIESAFLVPFLGVSIYYGEHDIMAFAISIVITGIIGFIAFALFKPKKMERITYKEGFMIVGLGWIVASAFGPCLLCFPVHAIPLSTPTLKLYQALQLLELQFSGR